MLLSATTQQGQRLLLATLTAKPQPFVLRAEVLSSVQPREAAGGVLVAARAAGKRSTSCSLFSGGGDAELRADDAGFVTLRWAGFVEGVVLAARGGEAVRVETWPAWTEEGPTEDGRLVVGQV